MPNHEPPPPVRPCGVSPVVLRPNAQRFLLRSIPWVVLALWVLSRMATGAGFGLFCVMGAGLFWMFFRSSSLTLDSEGFAYRGPGRPVSLRWTDVERFSVVTQTAFGFIPVNRYLGWNYSPAYKNYKRLAIPRALARTMGMADAMIKPFGFDVKELVAIMNDCLSQARAEAERKVDSPVAPR